MSAEELLVLELYAEGEVVGEAFAVAVVERPGRNSALEADRRRADGLVRVRLGERDLDGLLVRQSLLGGVEREEPEERLLLLHPGDADGLPVRAGTADAAVLHGHGLGQHRPAGIEREELAVEARRDQRVAAEREARDSRARRRTQDGGTPRIRVSGVAIGCGLASSAD
ncbi:MAG: hypothetical protein QM765_23115 [Myxococcales bacterium]